MDPFRSVPHRLGRPVGSARTHLEERHGRALQKSPIDALESSAATATLPSHSSSSLAVFCFSPACVFVSRFLSASTSNGARLSLSPLHPSPVLLSDVNHDIHDVLSSSFFFSFLIKRDPLQSPPCPPPPSIVGPRACLKAGCVFTLDRLPSLGLLRVSFLNPLARRAQNFHRIAREFDVSSFAPVLCVYRSA